MAGLFVVLAGSVFLASCDRSRRTRRPRPERSQPTQPVSVFDVEGEDAPLLDGADVASAGAPTPPGAMEELMSERDLGTATRAPSGGEPVRDPRTPEDVLAALQEDAVLKVLESSHEEELGDDAFEKADYVAAARHYERALELNPGLARARERLHQSKSILGRRSGLVRAVGEDLRETEVAERTMRLDDARNGLREARELLKDGSLDSLQAAERNLTRIADELTFHDFDADVSKDLEEAKRLLEQAEAARAAAEVQARRDKEQLVEDEMDRLRSDEERQARIKVRELTLKAADYIRFEEYAKAIDACEEILELQPSHRVAQYWLRDARQQLIDRQHAQLLAEGERQLTANRDSLDESAIPWTDHFVFPSANEWARIQKRRERLEAVQADDPEAIKNIKNLLETTEVSFEFQEKPLADVIAFLRQVTGINIDIDPEVLEEGDSLTVDLAVQNMKARNALRLILLQTDLESTFQEQILYITKKEKARGASEFAIYNVSDILNKIRDFVGPELTLRAPGDTEDEGAGGISIGETNIEEETALDPDSLQELIKDSTGGEEIWGDDLLYNMEYHKGLLLVNASRELHRDIQSVLQNLREDSDLFVMIEARFIDITDDFLEDIGIDSRALGLVNNLGTPFGNIINDSRTGGNDIGFVKQGSPVRDVTLIMGQDRWAGRVQHIIDGFTGLITGDRLRGGNGISGLTVQGTWLDPFQINAILRAVQEKSDVRQLTAPTITAHNGERVYVSVITQRAYIADYELVSGGTGFSIIEVADPIVATFQEGVILDVDPVISHDKKYVTLDVRPTMATLIGGVISTILISLGSFTNVAFQVPIGVPEVSLQQTFTSVTVPNGGTVLLGGFKSLSEAKYVSYLPILGSIPIVKNLFRRKAQISEKRSLVILITARIINPRVEEATQFNAF